MTLLCTAGHVDHGKSALVKALTGTDPDRLAEEKRRGMTIALGFVEWRLPTGFSVSLIDVPGHQRLIRTMAAGAHAVDGVLLGVSAVEGVMPQTREHLAICQLLGPRPVVAVISMIDRSDDQTVALRHHEITQLARETGADLVGIVACSAVTGDGLDALGSLVEAHFAALPARSRSGEPRLHVDRAFVMKGRGLVVTGTLIDGSFARKDAVCVLPEGVEARIRQIERHGEELETASPDARTALNLQGVAHESVQRGQTLVHPGSLRAGSEFGVSLQLLGDDELDDHALHHVMLHHGTQCCAARFQLLANPSGSEQPHRFAELKTTVPIVAVPGDRFLLRATSSDATLGGGVILDVAPQRSRRTSTLRVTNLARRGRGEPENVLVAELDRAPQGVRGDELRRLTGLSQERLAAVAAPLVAEQRVWQPDPAWLLSAIAAQRLRRTVMEAVHEHHRGFPSLPGIDIGSLSQQVRHPLVPFAVDDLLATGELCMPAGGVVAQRGWSADTAARAELLAWLERQGLEPATVPAMQHAGFREDALRSLTTDRLVVHIGAGFVAASAVDTARHTVVRFIEAHGPAATGDLCRVMGAPRRTGIPVLEHLDAIGVTKRLGDRRAVVWREREGNDPSEDAASAPPSRFEDGGAHLDPSTPKPDHSESPPRIESMSTH